MFAKYLFAVLLTACLSAGPVVADDSVHLLRDRQPNERPQLLFIGTVHFDNPGRDVVKTEVSDVTTPQRQMEIQEVITHLSKFRPTKVVVEWPLLSQATLTERYDAYRAGQYTLKSSEVDQLGLRLAAKLNLPKIYAADWNDIPPGAIDDYDYETYAENAGSEAKSRLSAIRNQEPDPQPEWMRKHTVLEWLQYLNRTDTQTRSNRHYFDYALLGNPTKAPGANWVGAWYGRNMRIFANLVRIGDDPKDRILVIYGNGHAFLQKEFAEQSGAYEVVDPSIYLEH